MVKTMNFGTEVDLHHFHPKDTRVVVEEFLRQARDAGYERVRIVHGKGRSQKKLQVHAILEAHEEVISFRDDGPNWGATLVFLHTGDQ